MKRIFVLIVLSASLLLFGCGDKVTSSNEEDKMKEETKKPQNNQEQVKLKTSGSLINENNSIEHLEAIEYMLSIHNNLLKPKQLFDKFEETSSELNYLIRKGQIDYQTAFMTEDFSVIHFFAHHGYDSDYFDYEYEVFEKDKTELVSDNFSAVYGEDEDNIFNMVGESDQAFYSFTFSDEGEGKFDKKDVEEVANSMKKIKDPLFDQSMIDVHAVNYPKFDQERVSLTNVRLYFNYLYDSHMPVMVLSYKVGQSSSLSLTVTEELFVVGRELEEVETNGGNKIKKYTYEDQEDDEYFFMWQDEDLFYDLAVNVDAEDSVTEDHIFEMIDATIDAP